MACGLVSSIRNINAQQARVYLETPQSKEHVLPLLKAWGEIYHMSIADVLARIHESHIQLKGVRVGEQKQLRGVVAFSSQQTEGLENYGIIQSHEVRLIYIEKPTEYTCLIQNIVDEILSAISTHCMHIEISTADYHFPHLIMRGFVSSSRSINQKSLPLLYLDASNSVEGVAKSVRLPTPISKTVKLRKEFVEQLRQGSKTVEIRIHKQYFRDVEEGQVVYFHPYDCPDQGVACRVIRKAIFESLNKALSHFGHLTVLPQSTSFVAALSYLKEIPKYEKQQKKWGVVGFELEVVQVEEAVIASIVRHRKRENMVHEIRRAAKIAHTNEPTPYREIPLRKKYIHLIQKGLKSAEGRIYSGQFKQLEPGQVIRFHYKQNSIDDVFCEILDIQHYPGFREMLEDKGIAAYLPDHDSNDLYAALELYNALPGFKRRAAKHGVVGLGLKLLDKQKFLATLK